MSKHHPDQGFGVPETIEESIVLTPFSVLAKHTNGLSSTLTKKRGDDNPSDDQGGYLSIEASKPSQSSSSVEGSLSEGLSMSGKPKKPKETMSIQDRKRFFIFTPTLYLNTSMRRWLSNIYAKLGVSRDDDEYWFYPSPPPLRTGSSPGSSKTISRAFGRSDETGRRTLTVNFSIVALFLEERLTDAQKHGYIRLAWYLSHLCGNWICCNWRHTTVEPGGIHASRNSCFKHSGHCYHSPKCMKSKKVKSLPMSRPRILPQPVESSLVL